MIIDGNLLAQTCVKAANLARKRTNHNFHNSPNDHIQHMLNVLQPESYVQPHKHESPDKQETFIILKGQLLVVLFNESGQELSRCILCRDTEVYGIEIPPRTYHTIAALEKDTCVYEVKDGPYDPQTDKCFAPWAPGEKDTELAKKYLNNLITKKPRL